MNKKGLSNEDAERKARMERARQAAADRLKGRGPDVSDAVDGPAAPAPAPVQGKKYVVKAGDTLGALALKFYGSAAKDKWMKIYEANKAVIGDNPNLIKVGQELTIPPDD